MAKIYKHLNNAPDDQVGRIDVDNGRVYRSQLGPDAYVGRVDYERGEVHRHQTGPDKYMGRVNEAGEVYAHRVGPDSYVARVERDGRVFRHQTLQPDDYVGRVAEIRHPVEGAAAWFIFFCEEEASETPPEAAEDEAS